MKAQKALVVAVFVLSNPPSAAGEHAGESNPLTKVQGSWEAATSTLLAEVSKC